MTGDEPWHEETWGVVQSSFGKATSFGGSASSLKRARPWVEEFVHFLMTHRGLGYESCRSARYFAQDFLSWRFKHGRIRWSRVSVEDLWSYAERCARQFKPRSANRGLSVLRRFLSFVQLRGACPLQLARSVPHVATFGQSVRPEVLDGRQRRALLASFKRTTGGGCRDYTMALCMVDLGLRSIEVVRLRLSDIDWENRILSVPATKTDRGRQLPLPSHLAKALQTYVSRRPPTDCDRLFVGHCLRTGQPVSTSAVHRAYAKRAQVKIPALEDYEKGRGRRN